MAFTDRARVKNLLNIPSTLSDGDTLIDTLVLVSNDFVLGEVGLDAEGSTEYTEKFDVDWDYQQEIMLTYTPVVSITSVTMGGSALEATSYYTTKTGALRLINVNSFFTFGRQTVTVVYNAGFVSVPEKLKHAATLICVHLYNKDPRSGYASERTGSYNYSLDKHTIPPVARMILDQYRRVFARAI